LPGSKKGSQESIEIVLPVLKHALDLINDSKKDVKNDHVKIQQQQHQPKSESTSADQSNQFLLCHHRHHHHHDFHQEEKSFFNFKISYKYKYGLNNS
jgi:hypothetical protein